MFFEPKITKIEHDFQIFVVPLQQENWFLMVKVYGWIIFWGKVRCEASLLFWKKSRAHILSPIFLRVWLKESDIIYDLLKQNTILRHFSEKNQEKRYVILTHWQNWVGIWVPRSIPSCIQRRNGRPAVSLPFITTY
jgi:hypothetical protein